MGVGLGDTITMKQCWGRTSPDPSSAARVDFFQRRMGFVLDRNERVAVAVPLFPSIAEEAAPRARPAPRLGAGSGPILPHRPAVCVDAN